MSSITFFSFNSLCLELRSSFNVCYTSRDDFCYKGTHCFLLNHADQASVQTCNRNNIEDNALTCPADNFSIHHYHTIVGIQSRWLWCSHESIRKTCPCKSSK